MHNIPLEFKQNVCQPGKKLWKAVYQNIDSGYVMVELSELISALFVFLSTASTYCFYNHKKNPILVVKIKTKPISIRDSIPDSTARESLLVAKSRQEVREYTVPCETIYNGDWRAT